MHNNNPLCIIAGVITGLINYFTNVNTSTSVEVIHVLFFSVLGGIGGYLGKLIIEKAHRLILKIINKNKKR